MRFWEIPLRFSNNFPTFRKIVVSSPSRMTCPSGKLFAVTSSGKCASVIRFLLTAPSGQGPPRYRVFTITLRHTTLGRTPLDERSARRRDSYLTTHNTHKTDRQPCPRWDSSLHSQQWSGRRPPLLTARPLGPALSCDTQPKRGTL